MMKRIPISQKYCTKNKEELFKFDQSVTLTTNEFDCQAKKIFKTLKMVKVPTDRKNTTSTTGNDGFQK